MTRDEQKSITEFITRVSACCHSEMDVEADAIIRALFVRNPEAAYRMTMQAMAQEAELKQRPAPGLAPAAQERGAPRRPRWLGAILKRDGGREREVAVPAKQHST